MESENILFSARFIMPSIQSYLEISTSSSISSADVSINTGFKGAVTLKGAMFIFLVGHLMLLVDLFI